MTQPVVQPKYNAENIELLAREVVDGYELSDILQNLVEQLCNHYEQDREAFESDWEQEKGV